ncbi:hypothetical protein V2J17_15210 [Lysobacter yananisis]|uniref:hypothetical protein n=1 Tax=Lysobacter yananisis TaxID=1003114 RepID=UPI003008279D
MNSLAVVPAVFHPLISAVPGNADRRIPGAGSDAFSPPRIACRETVATEERGATR